MKKLATTLILLQILTAIYCGDTTMRSALAADDAKEPSIFEEYLPSSNQTAQKTASDKIIANHAGTIAAMIAIIQTPTQLPDWANSRKLYAIQILGKYRAAEAAGPLMEIIDSNFNISTGALGAPADSSAIQALIDIGNPASHMAVEYLAKDKSEKRAAMYVRVIARVEGVDVGKFMVQMAADKEKDPAKKTRLEAAIALFDKADQPIP